MTLSTAAKDYIANHFGAGTPKCFVSSGITYTDPAGTPQTGSTQDVVSTLKIDAGGNARGPNGETYSDIVAANGGNFLSNDDIVWIGNSQSGTSQYCVAAAPPPGDRPETGPLEVYVGGGEKCPAGAPGVTIDETGAFAFFKTDPYSYIGVGEVDVHNISSVCYAYFAWEAKIWDGTGFTECPTTTPELQEITRYLAEATGGRPISITRLNASETDVVWGTFQVPTTMVGQKTICMSLWGNFDKQALIDELAVAGYVDLL